MPATSVVAASAAGTIPHLPRPRVVPSVLPDFHPVSVAHPPDSDKVAKCLRTKEADMPTTLPGGIEIRMMDSAHWAEDGANKIRTWKIVCPRGHYDQSSICGPSWLTIKLSKSPENNALPLTMKATPPIPKATKRKKEKKKVNIKK